jgi:3-phenylpropionate/trans-cinnamate dioxygenase ferredoxin reductase component
LQSAGLSDGYDQIETDGSAEPGSTEGFVVSYYRDGKLIAADCINRAKDFMHYKKLLGS